MDQTPKASASGHVLESPCPDTGEHKSFLTARPKSSAREVRVYESPSPDPKGYKLSLVATAVDELEDEQLEVEQSGDEQYEDDEFSEEEQKLTKPRKPGTIPPPLAPSVEEAYRRKCIQLRQRTLEVDESNEQARQRLVLLNKELQKVRLERAFLLENLAKRTSTNVEDSEGSPSPPPTSPLLQPKEKPLRTKRGHRKASFPTEGGPSSIGAAFNGGSPTSETFSNNNHELAPTTHPKANGYATGPPRRPKNSFDLYCSEKRPFLSPDETDPDRTLALGFSRLSPEEKESIQGRFENLRKAFEVENGNGNGSGADAQAERDDEDVEMADEGEGGFTAVNRE